MPRGRQLVGGVPALERAVQHARHEGGDARTRAYLRAVQRSRSELLVGCTGSVCSLARPSGLQASSALNGARGSVRPTHRLWPRPAQRVCSASALETAQAAPHKWRARALERPFSAREAHRQRLRGPGALAVREAAQIRTDSVLILTDGVLQLSERAPWLREARSSVSWT